MGKTLQLKDYQAYCQQTAKHFEDKEKEIMVWGLGLAGEAGDVAGCIKKTFSHSNDQTAGIRENLGDMLWYTAMIANYFKWDLEEILQENVAKLQARYPRGFSETMAKRNNTRVDWNEK
jgi:NTP pyrophosphatase (non-canonical NTP hydrolase)